MKYYRRNPGDYLSATGHLTLVEHGAYTVLMDTYYATENALPAERKALYRIAGAHDARERAAVDRVVTEFFRLEDGELVQDRIEIEIAAGREKAQKLADNGSKGGEARAKNREARAKQLPPSGSSNCHDFAQAKRKHIHQPSTISSSKPNGLARTVALLPDVEPKVVADWLEVRKAKKAPATPTAVAEIRREAGKAGISVQDALTICCARGWAGFKASWDWRSGAVPNKQEALEARNRAAVEQALEESNARH